MKCSEIKLYFLKKTKSKIENFVIFLIFEKSLLKSESKQKNGFGRYFKTVIAIFNWSMYVLNSFQLNPLLVQKILLFFNFKFKSLCSRWVKNWKICSSHLHQSVYFRYFFFFFFRYSKCQTSMKYSFMQIIV